MTAGVGRNKVVMIQDEKETQKGKLRTVYIRRKEYNHVLFCGYEERGMWQVMGRKR